MHPGQYTLINTPKERVLENSIEELKYHCDVLDCMGLGRTSKIQIHVGGVYGDKKSAKQRFIQNYNKLPEEIKKRLVIENDEKSYSLRDCLDISEDIEIPIIFDSFHHSCLNNGESNPEAIEKAGGTWKEEDGILMTDYSSQEPNTRVGTHARYIDIEHFRKYLDETQDFDFDIMLEIKDKEKSALKAIKEIL